MSTKHHILFDLDGTLTDSFKGIATVCNMPYLAMASLKTICIS